MKETTMKIGNGRTYEWLENWAKLPEGVVFGFTHGVVVDAKDNVYVHNKSKDAVCVFDRDGNFIRSWGPEFQNGAHGMFLSEEKGKEYLYLADNKRHLVMKATLDGEEVWTIGMPDRPDLYESEKQYKPTDVCVAPNGDFYVFDGYGRSWVHQYTRDAKYIRSIGGPGSEPGKLSCPHGGWIDTRKNSPELYIADRKNNRIQVFTLDGRHLRFITNEMRRPCCFYQWKQEMYVPDLEARVTILDMDDKPIAVLGDNPEAPKTTDWPNIPDKLQPGKFNSPHACCVDSRGDLYVAEWISTGRLIKLRRTE